MTQQARAALMCLAFACCEADWCLLDAIPSGASDTDTSGGTDASVDHCNNWSSNSDTETIVGLAAALDGKWTNNGHGLCSDDRRLYCFEDPL